MNFIYDLHSHSTASDGTLSPTALVAHACAQGVNVLALTDHDATSGIAEAQQAAAGTNLTVVSGIEVSVTWNHQLVHIVGLGVDGASADLMRGLEGLRTFRVWRGEEITRRLEKSGIGGAYQGACALAGSPAISRTHIARYLVAQGLARNVQQAFDRYLKRGKPGHVPGQWASLQDAVSWIRGASGQAVVAHPARYGLSATRLRQLLKDFKEAGGEALEVISGSQPHGATPTLARYAQQLELLASVGSDYHGPGQGANDLGRVPALPPECKPIWREWLVSKQSSHHQLNG